MTDTTTIEQEITALEQQVRDNLERLTALKKQRAANALVQNYQLLDKNGNTVTLAQLFGDKDDLIVIHNMGKACAYCTMWADGFVGFSHHLNNRAAFALVSPDTPDVQKEFAQSRGWNFAVYSGAESSFIEDMGFRYQHEGQHYYSPGYSTFRKHADGSITRVGYDYFGPGDMYCSPWHIFELLQDGANGWYPQKEYAA